MDRDIKITVSYPKEKEKLNVPPPPPPPKVDQVKFVSQWLLRQKK
jgi:protein TonB